MRVAVFIGPVIAFIIAKRWCISLQRKDNETLLHGYETGIIMRSPRVATPSGTCRSARPAPTR